MSNQGVGDSDNLDLLYLGGQLVMNSLRFRERVKPRSATPCVEGKARPPIIDKACSPCC